MLCEMSTIAENLRRLRRQAGLTRKQFARVCRGVSASTIGRIENGESEGRPSTLKKIAAGLNLPLEAVVGVSADADHDAPQPYITRKLPLVGEIPAGGPAETWEILGEVDVLADQWGPDRYVLRVHGDSMHPDIRHGDLILMERYLDAPLDVADTRICGVLVNGEKTLKEIRVDWRDSKAYKVILRPRNPRYPTMEIKEGDEFRVLAIALEIAKRKL